MWELMPAGTAVVEAAETAGVEVAGTAEVAEEEVVGTAEVEAVGTVEVDEAFGHRLLWATAGEVASSRLSAECFVAPAQFSGARLL